MQFFLRAVVAVILYLAFFYVLQPVVHLMGFNINPDVFILIHVALALAAFWYVVWGKPVPTPWA